VSRSLFTGLFSQVSFHRSLFIYLGLSCWQALHSIIDVGLLCASVVLCLFSQVSFHRSLFIGLFSQVSFHRSLFQVSFHMSRSCYACLDLSCWQALHSIIDVGLFCESMFNVFFAHSPFPMCRSLFIYLGLFL